MKMDIYRDIRKVIYSLPILIADDDIFMRKLLGEILTKVGYNNLNYAENGVEVMEKIKTSRPACILLDIEMPEMNGFEVLKEIRSNPATIDLPVIVITGHDEREVRNEILRAGASNLISKPIDNVILLERITYLIERKLILNKLSEYYDRLSSELAYAAEMQRDIMPTLKEQKKIEGKYGVSLASHFRPSSELGGDAWFLQEIDDDKFGIMFVDFSGHGVSAALNTFRMQSIISRLDPSLSSPAKYLEIINQEISKILSVEQYCTSLYMVVDTKKSKIKYAGAGAPPPIYGQISAIDTFQGDASGLPMGINADVKYKDLEINFPKGSFIFLYSDALYETELADNKTLEISGVVDLVQTYKHRNSSQALENIILYFDEKVSEPLPDDLTAVWLYH